MSSAPGSGNGQARAAASSGDGTSKADDEIRYIQYTPAHESTYLEAIRQMISKDLSEPYSIYVYRYFLYQWGDLCFMAMDKNDTLIGVVVNKLERHRSGNLRGYVAMLAVHASHRGRGIATHLVRLTLDKMIALDADEVALETEITNTPAIKLYERLGFLRSKRLHRYYLNGNTAFRLVLYLKEGVGYAQGTCEGHGEPEGAMCCGALQPGSDGAVMV